MPNSTRESRPSTGARNERTEHGTGDYAHLLIVDALATFDEAGLVNLLIGALGSRHRSVRLTAVEHLGELGDRRAIAPLSRALSDEEWMVREDTARSLKTFADVSSIEPLIGQLCQGGGFSLVAAIEAWRRSVTRERPRRWSCCCVTASNR